ncbi:MAG: hypothetical protein HRU29_15895 [Rhizobiales bacterium]|nr:hypothetical protein [Hyphomicrobiales bacterium]NRB15879.1 hypothetical protein [Hyphomicrobiales bacterium]
MRKYIRLQAVITATILMISASFGWETGFGKNVNDVTYAHSQSQSNEDNHILSFSCAKDSDNGLQVLLTGLTFPNLEAFDDKIATFIFRYELPKNDSFETKLMAWYFAPDSAWVGSFKVFDAEHLSVFSKAVKLSILNEDRKTILTFPMDGSSRAARLLKVQCGIGNI